MDAIARTATSQRGLITSEQLLAAGASRTTVSRWCEEGRLHRVHRGVYAVGHRHLDPTAGLLAATLAGGTATYLARLHAGRFLGLSYKTRRDGRIEVTAGQAGRNRPGIAFLQFATMREGDLQVVEGVRCTSVSRTLVDLASALSLNQLERAVERAEFREQLDRAEIAEIIARIPRLRGVRNLRKALGAEALRAVGAETELERLALRLILDAGLPRPELQRKLYIDSPPREIRPDFFWPNTGVILEADGPHHRRPNQRRRDGERDARLRAHGYTVLRASDEELKHAPLKLLQTLARLL